MLKLTLSELDLDRIAASGQCFTWTKLGPRNYGISHRDHYVEAHQDGEQFVFSCSPEEFEAVWSPYLDLETDYGAVRSSLDPEDRYLQAATEFGRGIRILRQDLWEVLVCFLISQNNNITRITRSVSLLREQYGRQAMHHSARTPAPRTFPRPEELAGATLQELQALGLGYRARYLRALLDQFGGGGFDAFEAQLRTGGEEEALECLLSLYGVGKKVADCVLLFGLHRVDAFPVDTHIRKILESHYPLGFPYERYRGFLGILQQFLFYWDLCGGENKAG